jgi:hypothetical protein
MRMENEKPELTLEQRVAALEADNKELRKLMAGLFQSLSEGLETQKGISAAAIPVLFALCKVAPNDSPLAQWIRYFLIQSQVVLEDVESSESSAAQKERLASDFSEMLRSPDFELPEGYTKPSAGP